MEAAPVDLGTWGWGQYEKKVKGTKTGIGFGKRNTELIIAALNREGESRKAAQLCKAYTLNGYNDWFLPSKYELDLIYKNLKKNNMGGFAETWYWSSSDVVNFTDIAWVQRFSDGSKSYADKGNQFSVRAVRAF